MSSRIMDSFRDDIEESRSFVPERESGGENCVDTLDNGERSVFREDSQRNMEYPEVILRTSSIADEFSSGSNCGMDLSESKNGDFENVSQHSSSLRKLDQSEVKVNGYAPRTMNKLRDKWLCKLRSINCMRSGNMEDNNVESTSFGQVQSSRVQRVNVCHSRKRLKELSALFRGQEIQAHKGSILMMKFSLDGQYLASAGEDELIEVWRVVKDERLDTMDIPEIDPSCLYFSINQFSELRPLAVEKHEVKKSRTPKKTTESACIILPPTIFRILETPLHVFQGHNEQILDLSWSQNNFLLSSSVDKTVRLWRLGLNQCLKVFRHSDYVTCIQFNPVNDDYFISGSIDGIVRIWEVNRCRVVDWMETRDIITAISFRPDGKGGIFGSMTGTCHFFKVSDNHLQLESQMCLSNKKSLSCKRITGFQFLRQDPSNILVTSGDSSIRTINSERDLISKFKGLGSAGSHVSASFTSDGKHIISASDDSNVYIWKSSGRKDSEVIYKSFECFSCDASVVIPWPGSKVGNSEDSLKSRKLDDGSIQPLPFSASGDFSLDSISKGSATWPEEKLSTPNLNLGACTSSMSKSQHKLFKTSFESLSGSHAWGLVIVTGDWDGRIRSFRNYGLPACTSV